MSRPSLYVVSAISLLVSACAGRHPGAVTSPVPLAVEIGDGGSPVIATTVNGAGPFWFVFDTGASGSTLLPPILTQLTLPPLPKGFDEVSTAGGSSRSVNFFRVDSLRAGPLFAARVPAPLFQQPVFKSHTLAGVAGVDMARDHAVEFDLAARVMRVHATGFRGGPGWTRVPSRYDAKAGAFFIGFTVNGVDGEGFIDTGAQRTILGPRFVRALGWHTDTTGRRAVGSAAGAEGKPVPIFMRRVDGFALGSRAFPAGSVLFGDLSHFQRMEQRGANAAIIGMDFLGRMRFLIDYPRKAVWMYSPAAPA
jgi:predicted aspartyl protease